ncbi:MAG: type II toxin-antitoxin system PemK/MazF family toxin [Algoriphagus sp.]|jgi:mRNA interferase MazF|nr:type II toxin-antitoxin system PemK/MazF family toxin [Algoriphagus sp.]
MRQGEIWWTDLNPSTGSKQRGRRAELVISGNLLNKYLEVVLDVPLTTQIKRYKGNPILEPNSLNQLKLSSEALVFQVRSISKFRLLEKIGDVEPEIIKEIKETLNDILTL